MSKKVVSGLLKTALAVTGAFAGVSYWAFREIMHRDSKLPGRLADVFNKTDGTVAEVTKNDEREQWFNRQIFDEHELINSRGLRLKGYCLMADKPSDVFVFCSHGYRNHGRGEFNYTTKYYHDKGFNVFLVDHQAAGESDGEYITFGYNESRDCLEWLDYIKDVFGEDIQIILHGVSMGSATVMLMCGNENLPSNVKFAIADCGYTTERDEFEHNLSNVGVTSFPILDGINFFNKLVSGFSFEEVSPIESVSRARLPMLFVHGKADDFVPTFMAGRLYEACASENKDLLLIEGAAHARSYRTDSTAYEAKVNTFIDRFIQTPVEAKLGA